MVSTFAQHNIPKVERMLDERSGQTVSTPFNIFQNEGNVEALLDESLSQFKFDSTSFKQAFNKVE